MDQISDFAEQILFATSMELKLKCQSQLSDDRRCSTRTLPKLPHRPKGLALSNSNSGRVKFPAASELHEPKARGRVLHFFANHELLALELMALTLLRFPEAPPRYRRCLVATMRDEQKHLKLYLERMNSLGVELGEIPLNSFFWDLLSSVNQLEQFVAGMSLTFEQANIDFSLYFKKQFQRVNDSATAAIMQNVLEDEIAHVRHGVNYFSFHAPSESELWERYNHALVYPLTPARAKGQVFTRPHRERAGLPPSFIDRLEVYTHSKGRVPNVHFFNPSVELSLANGPGFSAPKHLEAIRQDLGSLPMYLCSGEDVVLVEKVPQTNHLARLKRLGYRLPEFVEVAPNQSICKGRAELAKRQLNQLKPWGWSFDAEKLFAPLFSAARAHNISLDSFVLRQRPLYSKKWLNEHLDECLATVALPWSNLLVKAPLPQFVSDWDTLERVVKNIVDHGYRTVVMKAPFSTAGGGQLRVNVPDSISESNRRWIKSRMDRQGGLVVEPWFDKVLDGSYLFQVSQERLSPVGLSHFFTDGRGQYRGTAIGALGDTMPADVKSFVFNQKEGVKWIQEFFEAITSFLHPELSKTGAVGPMGLDFMIVKDTDGQFRLRAPLELNPRATMGHVAKGIARPFGSRVRGLWFLVSQKEVTSAGYPDFAAFESALSETLPPRFEGDQRQFCQGVFATTPRSPHSSIGSFCMVAKDFGQVVKAGRSVLPQSFFSVIDT